MEIELSRAPAHASTEKSAVTTTSAKSVRRTVSRAGARLSHDPGQSLSRRELYGSTSYCTGAVLRMALHLGWLHH